MARDLHALIQRSFANARGLMLAIARALMLAIVLSNTQATAAPPGSPWGADYFPNVELITQDGQKVRFYDDLIKDKVVAINFIFTTCSQICPAETAKLRQVQKLLGDRVGRDVFFYSISIDPERDIPAVLKQYAQKFDAGGPGWLFLTGKADDILLLRSKLGLYRGAQEEPTKADHGTSLIVGNEANGQWIKRSPFDNAQVLAGVLGNWLHNWKVPAVAEAGAKRSYSAAARLAHISDGEQLFRRRCVTCHSGGSGESLGPDLAGVVQKRPRAWLTRWLMVPDQMLAEKDSIALELYARFKEVPMPNLGLTAHDAEALIEYLEDRSGHDAMLRRGVAGNALTSVK